MAKIHVHHATEGGRVGGRLSNLEPSAGKDSQRGTNHLLGHKFSLQAASVNGMSRWGNGCVPGAKWAACCCVARSPWGSLILMLLQSLSFGPGKPLPEEGGFPLLKIYELPLNGLGWPAATLHAFRGFPATKVPGKPLLMSFSLDCFQTSSYGPPSTSSYTHCVSCVYCCKENLKFYYVPPSYETIIILVIMFS